MKNSTVRANILLTNKQGGLFMKKFLRNLFSGYFIVLIILLLELAIFIFIQFFLEDTVALSLAKPKKMSNLLSYSFIYC